MKLSEAIIGYPVREINPKDQKEVKTRYSFLCRRQIPAYGHVIGFYLNSQDEVVIEVRWVDGSVAAIHPTRLEALK